MFAVIGIIALICFAFVFSEDAHAQVQGYRVTSVLNVGTDSTNLPPCSCIAYYALGSFGGDADSMRRVLPDTVKLEGWTYPDTLARYILLGGSQLNTSYNPSVIFYWYVSASCTTGAPIKIIRDNTPQFSHAMVKVDTVDQVLENIGGGAGSGAFSCTTYVYDTLGAAIVANADLLVWSSDTSTVVATGTSNASGYIIFGLDAGTYEIAAQAQNYFMQTAYEQITISGHDSAQVPVWGFTPGSAPSPDSCNLLIYTDVALSRAKIKMHAVGTSGSEDKPVMSTGGVWLDRREIQPNPKANAGGLIEVMLVRTNGTIPKAVYDITILNAKGKELARFDNYQIPDSATHTLVVN